MEEQNPQKQPFEPNPFGQNPFGNGSTAPPKNWLVESILVTLFCCLPFGIAGIVFAASVNSKHAAGDHLGAQAAAASAAKYTKIGFFVGIGVIILYVIGVFALGIGGAMFSAA